MRGKRRWHSLPNIPNVPDVYQTTKRAWSDDGATTNRLRINFERVVSGRHFVMAKQLTTIYSRGFFSGCSSVTNNSYYVA